MKLTYKDAVALRKGGYHSTVATEFEDCALAQAFESLARAHRLIKDADAVIFEAESERTKRKEEAAAEEIESDKLFDAWENWERVTYPEEDADRPAAIASMGAYPSDLAHEGLCVIFEENEGVVFVGPVLRDPNWGHVMMHFIRCIGFTGDEHHCFLEALEPTTDYPPEVGSVSPDVTVLRICTGS